MPLKLLIVCIVLFGLSVHAGHTPYILFVSCFQKSPIIALQGLAEEMAARSYRVSFTVTEEDKHLITAPNVTFLSGGRDPKTHEEYGFTADILDLFRGEADFAFSMWEVLLPKLQEDKPDLIVFDTLTPLGYALAEKLGVKSVELVPHRIGLKNLAEEPIFHPSLISPLSVHMTTAERVANYIQSRVFQIVLPFFRGLYFNPFFKSVGLPPQYTNNDNPYGRTRLSIVGTHFGLEIPQPLNPITQVVGSFLPRTSTKLSTEVQDWLDKESNVVYVSLGTNAEWTPALAKTFVDTFSAMKDTRFLWSIKKKQQDQCLTGVQLPTNLKIVSFVDQYSVLSHPNVGVFASHCGYNSLQEAVYLAKVILGVPVFGDQIRNAVRVKELGIGLNVNRDTVTQEELQTKLHELLHNDSYNQAIVKASKAAHYADGRKRAGDLLEMTMDIGYEHLVSPDQSFGFIEYYNLDVYTAVAILVLVIANVLKCSMKMCCKRSQKSKKE